MDKVRITIWLDLAVVEGFKALAEAMPGTKYQALMNEALRLQLEAEKKDSVEARLARLEAKLLK